MKPVFQSPKIGTKLDHQLAWPLFVTALLILLIGGFLLHTEPGEWGGAPRYSRSLRVWLWTTLALLYVILIGETVAHWRMGCRNLNQHRLFLLIPFMRLCCRDHADGNHVWIPGMGWREKSAQLERVMSRLFSKPMIIISLTVLPVIVIEIFWWEKIQSSAYWRFWIETVTGFIWMAFVFEFVVMFTVVRKKLRYCKKNWIDIVVILLPLVNFLAIARLGRLLKVQQLTRSAKVFRMRGLAIRSWRAVVALDMIDKVLGRDLNYRIEKIELAIEDHEEELKLLRLELNSLREQVPDDAPI